MYLPRVKLPLSRIVRSYDDCFRIAGFSPSDPFPSPLVVRLDESELTLASSMTASGRHACGISRREAQRKAGYVRLTTFRRNVCTSQQTTGPLWAYVPFMRTPRSRSSRAKHIRLLPALHAGARHTSAGVHPDFPEQLVWHSCAEALGVR